MCKYCKYVGDDDAWDSNKNLFKENITINKLPFMDIEVYLSHNHNEEAEMVLWVDNMDPCNLIAFKKLKIKYCPLCAAESFRKIKGSFGSSFLLERRLKMLKIFKTLYTLKCKYHKFCIDFWIVMGNKRMANKHYVKVLKMFDAYKDFYIDDVKIKEV